MHLPSLLRFPFRRTLSALTQQPGKATVSLKESDPDPNALRIFRGELRKFKAVIVTVRNELARKYPYPEPRPSDAEEIFHRLRRHYGVADGWLSAEPTPFAEILHTLNEWENVEATIKIDGFNVHLLRNAYGSIRKACPSPPVLSNARLSA